MRHDVTIYTPVLYFHIKNILKTAVSAKCTVDLILHGKLRNELPRYIYKFTTTRIYKEF